MCDPTSTILLVRHGQSEDNAGRPSDGPGSAALTPIGERQARAVADGLAKAPHLIVVSSFRRARQTAAVTLARFPEARLEEWPVEEFHYLGAMAYRGTTRRDRRAARDEYWRAGDPLRVCEPGAESFAAFHARVHAVRERLERSGERRIVLFSHKKFLHGLMWSWSEGGPAADADAMARFRAFDRGNEFPNGAWVEVTLAGQAATVGAPHVRHLDGVVA